MWAWNKIDRLKALAADLGVEIDAARSQSPLPQDHQHALRREIEIGRELVGVPAEQHVPRVGVDAAEGALDRGVDQFVHHRVAGEGRVVGLDVEFDVLLESVLADEIEAGRRVEVVLVFGRLFGLGLEQELPLEADRLGEIDRHVHEAGQVIELALHVGVVEVGVPLAASPEDIIHAPQFVRDLDRLFYLRRGVRKYVGVGAGGRPVHVAGMGKEVGRSPEELDAGALLGRFQVGDDRLEVAVGRQEGSSHPERRRGHGSNKREPRASR